MEKAKKVTRGTKAIRVKKVIKATRAKMAEGLPTWKLLTGS